jgi:hypothetical protein
MATGQIGFHRQKEVKKVHIEKRINEIVNRLNKTKVEKFPDLAREKAEFEKEERRKEKAALDEKVFFYISSSSAHAKRAQRKQEERELKAKKDKVDRERRMYDDMYGKVAIQKATESKEDDYDPEEDFW